MSVVESWVLPTLMLWPTATTGSWNSELLFPLEVLLVPGVAWKLPAKKEKQSLRESIVSRPARLGYSLERRYRPRLRACRQAGADVEVVLRLAARTDASFCQTIGLPLEEYAACRSGLVEHETEARYGYAYDRHARYT